MIRILDYVKKNKFYFLKFLLLIIAILYGINHYNPILKNYIFFFIETQILYRKSPPMYSDVDFKNTEPNKVCAYMNPLNLNTNSYSRSQYFDYSCSSLAIVDNKTDYSIQYLATGNVFNIDTVLLHVNFLNKDQKYETLLEIKPYIALLLNKTTGQITPFSISKKLMTFKDFDALLNNNTHVRVVFTNDDLTIYIN